jgi:hypothetical protein
MPLDNTRLIAKGEACSRRIAFNGRSGAIAVSRLFLPDSACPPTAVLDPVAFAMIASSAQPA